MIFQRVVEEPHYPGCNPDTMFSGFFFLMGTFRVSTHLAWNVMMSKGETDDFSEKKQNHTAQILHQPKTLLTSFFVMKPPKRRFFTIKRRVKQVLGICMNRLKLSIFMVTSHQRTLHQIAPAGACFWKTALHVEVTSKLRLFKKSNGYGSKRKYVF